MSFKTGPLYLAPSPQPSNLDSVLAWETGRPHSGWLELDRRSARPFRMQRAELVSAGHCLRSLPSARFGIEFAADPMYELVCGRRTWMLLFERNFLDSASVASLIERKAVPMAIASRSEQTGAYSISYLALCSPGQLEGEAHLAIYRTTGRLAFGGTARVEGGCASFSIRAVSRPGAFAIEFEGKFDGRSLVVETALSSAGIQVPKRQPVEE